MPQVVRVWTGDKPHLAYHERLHPDITLALGREYEVFSVGDAQKTSHGLYQMRTEDIWTKQTRLRPLITPEILMKMGVGSGQSPNG